MIPTYNTARTCPFCSLRFTTHSTAFIVKCPDCAATFKLSESEPTNVVGGYAEVEE